MFYTDPNQEVNFMSFLSFVIVNAWLIEPPRNIIFPVLKARSRNWQLSFCVLSNAHSCKSATMLERNSTSMKGEWSRELLGSWLEIFHCIVGVGSWQNRTIGGLLPSIRTYLLEFSEISQDSITNWVQYICLQGTFQNQSIPESDQSPSFQHFPTSQNRADTNCHSCYELLQK